MRTSAERTFSANLSSANLSGANLVEANLAADLTGRTSCGRTSAKRISAGRYSDDTIFGNSNLTGAKGLHDCRHIGLKYSRPSNPGPIRSTSTSFPPRLRPTRRLHRIPAFAAKPRNRVLFLLHQLQPPGQSLRPPPARHPARPRHPLLARRKATTRRRRHPRPRRPRHPPMGQSAPLLLKELPKQRMGRNRTRQSPRKGTNAPKRATEKKSSHSSRSTSTAIYLADGKAAEPPS